LFGNPMLFDRNIVVVFGVVVSQRYL